MEELNARFLSLKKERRKKEAGKEKEMMIRINYLMQKMDENKKKRARRKEGFREDDGENGGKHAENLRKR